MMMGIITVQWEEGVTLVVCFLCSIDETFSFLLSRGLFSYREEVKEEEEEEEERQEEPEWVVLHLLRRRDRKNKIFQLFTSPHLSAIAWQSSNKMRST